MGRLGTLPMPPEDFGLPFTAELRDDLTALQGSPRMHGPPYTSCERC